MPGPGGVGGVAPVSEVPGCPALVGAVAELLELLGELLGATLLEPVAGGLEKEEVLVAAGCCEVQLLAVAVRAYGLEGDDAVQ